MELKLNEWCDIQDLTQEEKLDEDIRSKLIEFLALKQINEELEKEEGNIE